MAGFGTAQRGGRSAFDEDLNADLAGVQLHYDIKTGLTYVKE